MHFFRHFSEEECRGLLEDIRFKIIDRIYGKDMIRGSIWEHKLETFTPRGLNVREQEL